MATSSETGKVRFISFGEAMLRFQPVPGQDWKGVPSATSEFTRSVGGDELNVMVALAKLGCETSWVSVLPSGPLGAVVKSSAEDAKVDIKNVVTVEGASMGCYHVFPKERVTHFERMHSAFCTQGPGLFDWSKILAEQASGSQALWMHQSGIAPMLGPNARASWLASIRASEAASVPVSVDLNHRPALGTLPQLWAVVEPELPRISLLILSVDSTFALAQLLDLTTGSCGGTDIRAGGVYSAEDDLMQSIQPKIQAIHAKLKGPALACVMKTRDAAGRQQRWSLLVDGQGIHTTAEIPTMHSPKDECGGGSAWAAGVVHRLGHDLLCSGKKLPAREGGFVVFGASATAAVRRGDILAALSQETVGDHCTATHADLLAVEESYVGVGAMVDGLASRVGSVGSGLSEAAAEARVSQALQRIDSAKVIGIIRAKHEECAVKRAVELADMGLKAIEVTADSAGFKEGRLLPAVVSAIGERCLVGVGTVTSMADLELAAKGGAHFALSPVCPTVGFGEEGFCRQCHKRGVLAMPAAYTPQEIYHCVEALGALTVKIFPAQLWNPGALKDLRRIGDYGKYRLCPSGGIDAKNAEAWLEAGACAVGMGSCLVGKDVAIAPGDTEALVAAEKEWEEKFKPEAQAFAKKLGLC